MSRSRHGERGLRAVESRRARPDRRRQRQQPARWMVLPLMRSAHHLRINPGKQRIYTSDYINY